MSRKSAASRPYRPALARTQETAALTDSFITSPSDPVNVSSPTPGMWATSMNSTSPPYGVHPSATATPGRRTRSATSLSTNVGAPSASATVSGVTTAFDWSPPARRRAAFRHNVSSADRRDHNPASQQ